MKRNATIDIMRAIAIVLVVMGHSNSCNALIKQWIYAFHMPLFFVITGLTFHPGKLEADYIRKKIDHLLVPYFLWAMIYSSFSFKNLGKIVYASYLSITSAEALSSLWFLPVMFVATLLASSILMRTDNKGMLAGICVGMYVLSILLPKIKWGYPLSLDIAIMATCFILCGYLVKGYINCKPSMRQLLVMLAVGLTVTTIYRFDSINDNSYVLMSTKRIGNPIIFLADSLSGTLLTFSLAEILGRSVCLSRCMQFIGKNTMVILCLHKPMISVMDMMIFRNIPMHWCIQLMMTSVFTIFLSCLFGGVIDRFAPFLSGRVIQKQ